MHLAHATLAEVEIADGQGLIHQQHLGIDVDGHGEGEADHHTAGVGFHRPVDEVADFGEGFDFPVAAVDLAGGKAEDGAVQAVHAKQPGVDAQGSCIGQRGMRVMNVVNELSGEKIDVVLWDAEPAKFVENALSPAEVISVTVDEQLKTAQVVVPERQLSLAIGKEGQNARLAAKLTGWRIDIKAKSTPPKLAAAVGQ